MSTLELLKEHSAEIHRIVEKHGVTGLRVFGSVARGDARPDSDVDLLVEVGAETSPWFPAGLILDLEAILGRKVEIVTERALDPALRDTVLQEARPV